jgi:hypothetical protein
VATAASAILLALASIDDLANARSVLLSVGVSLGAAGILGMIFIRPSYARLLEERNDATIQAGIRSELLQRALISVLKRLASELKITNTHFRLSVYCHRGEHFVMLARHSGHSKWSRAGRMAYRESSDVISEAWYVGKSVVVDLPGDTSQRVRLQVENQGFSESDARGLTMPSRSLVGFRLVEGDDHVGVIVLESTQPRGVNSKTLDALPASVFVATIASVMAISRDHFPAMVRQHVDSQSKARKRRRPAEQFA